MTFGLEDKLNGGGGVVAEEGGDEKPGETKLVKMLMQREGIRKKEILKNSMPKQALLRSLLH